MNDSNIQTCAIYKGRKKEDTFLFIEKADEFDRVPAALIELLGELSHVMDLDLGPTRKLANANIDDVRAQLLDVGYYLQMIKDDKDPTESLS